LYSPTLVYSTAEAVVDKGFSRRRLTPVFNKPRVDFTLLPTRSTVFATTDELSSFPSTWRRKLHVKVKRLEIKNDSFEECV
jgi:hypothetical protein